jgi:lysophospholipase L1-like esterase
LETLRADIAEAEVIVFFGNPRGDSSEGGVTGGMEICIDGYKAPDDCTPELYEPYIENLKAIYDEILALRKGKPTIIRAVDFYNPIISRHRANNVEVECTQCFEIFNSAVRQAAEAYNIPLISVYDAFNGSNHDEDPREKGYIGSDGVHASEQGRQVIADLLSEAGYEPIEP